MSSLWINGQSVAGEGVPLRSTNPVDDSVVWEGNEASAAQVQAAVQAADDALDSWAALPLAERESIVTSYGEELKQHADELANLITRETGKLPGESLGEVNTCIGKVKLSIRAFRERRAASVSNMLAGADRAEINYRPVGPTLVLGPYNFPAHLPGGQIIPALLAGNTIIFKPSEITPAVGEWLTAAWHRAGLPAGVLNLVQGGRQVAEAALDQTPIGAVMFTGSYATGRAIHQRLAGRPHVLLSLEMGGNNPLVVLPDENLNTLAGMIVASAFTTAGQRCTCARRLIVVDDPQSQQLIDTLVQRMQRLRVGLPSDDPEPFIGPLISRKAATQLLEAQQTFHEAGGRPLVAMEADVRCPALLRPGLIDMTDVEDVPDDEYFGPWLQLYRATDLDHAIQLANQTRFGLSAALLGGTKSQFELLRSRVRAGVINWNRQTTGASGELPFGGLGDSGNHRPAGYWMVDACADPVASLMQHTLNDDHGPFDRMQL